MKKRICIFVFFDKQGIVDGYVIFLLAELMKEIDELVIVVNGFLRDGECDKFSRFSSKIFYRNNQGLDAGGFKEGMCKFVGWDYLKQFDSILLMNNTFYGPFYPFAEMFNEMDNRKLDFWGITQNYDSVSAKSKSGIFKRHIQTYFVMIENHMFSDYRFVDYWENLPMYSGFDDVVMNHETKFTSIFESYGFRSGVYTDTSYTESNDPIYNINPYAMLPYDLIRFQRCPILKRKIFSIGGGIYQIQSDQLQPVKAIEYVEQNTDYDTAMIYKNLFRCYRSIDLEENLCLNNHLVKNTSADSNSTKIIVVFVNNLHYIKVIQETFKRINPAVIVITNSKEVNQYCKEKLINSLLSDYSEDTFNAMKLIKEYVFEFDYVGILNTNLYKDPFCTRNLTSLQRDIRLLFCSDNTINSVVMDMENHKYIGMMLSPLNNQQRLKNSLSDSDVTEISKKMGFSTSVINNVFTYYSSASCWIKSCVLRDFYQLNDAGNNAFSIDYLPLLFLSLTFNSNRIAYTLTDEEDLILSQLFYTAHENNVINTNPDDHPMRCKELIVFVMKHNLSYKTKATLKKYTPWFIKKFLNV